MVKAKQQMQSLSKKKFSCGSYSKSKHSTCFTLTRNMLFSRRRRKRKVGVTLISRLKKQLPVNSLLNEPISDPSVTQKVIGVVHKTNEYSNKYRLHSDLKCLSSVTSKSADCYTPDIVLCRNDLAGSCAQTTNSSCFSPIVIDDSTDTDHSSVADTTNVFSTSAVSEAGNSEDADYFEEGIGRITHGLGYVCYEFNSATVLMLKLHSSVSVCGKLLARCVSGNAVVHGFAMNLDVGWQKIFSPSTHSLLVVKATDGEDVVDDADDWMLMLADEERRQVEGKSIEYPVILLLQRLVCPAYDFASSADEFRMLRSQVSGSYLQSVDVTVVGADSNTAAITEPEAFSCVADEFAQCAKEEVTPTVVICGGLNSGKSTFCRYIVNTLLNHVTCIAYLECDPGQSEFTPSGCISLHLVSEPVLGPPFSHQRTAHSSMFIGRPSPSGCAQMYIRAIQRTFAAYLQLSPRPPLIVNTMGWMKDDGLRLLIDTLHIVRPSYVVQLRMDAGRETKHLPNITPDFVASTPGLVYSQVSKKSSLPHHRWIQLTSEVRQHQWRGSHSKAAWYRDLATLGHLGGIFDQLGIVKSLRSVVPYRVKWCDVALNVSHEMLPRSQILYAINGNVVALCIADDKQMMTVDVPDCPKLLRKGAICECVGFGVVRSLCAEDKTMYILTPVEPSILDRVNCIQCGAVSLPKCLRITSEPVACEEPYVDHVHKVPYVRRQRTKRRRSSHRVSSQLNSTAVE